MYIVFVYTPINFKTPLLLAYSVRCGHGCRPHVPLGDRPYPAARSDHDDARCPAQHRHRIRTG